MNEIVRFAIAQYGSQKKLADACGVTQGAVWKWLHGQNEISPQYVYAISRATDGHFKPHQIRPDLPELFPQP
ncbi:helix-turn-helix domain-containing protein [Pantoea sp. Al-1710]|uniref:Helix-turn-helix domain-containing protein n=1 Tax=Candidatus Pantoea communis TaxID=2608354 RepID=A0ABX0RLI1_9GAMM|nr:helix-turn-helix domain-containing protein [Pantoea sp. Cy-640]NIG17328.1 helix-turn-helix domain-containing protein [Pantoea communis]